MKKRLIALLLILVVVMISISVFSSPVSAVTYHYSDGYELYRESDSNGWIINKYSDDVEKLNIPEMLLDDYVTTVGGNSFEDRQRLTEVTLPDSVTTISAYAFSGCKALQSITFGSGLKNIYAGAFRNCDSLSLVDLSNTSLDYIGNAAFYSCDQVMTVLLPDSATAIGSSSFANCPSLKKIIINKNVTSIAASAFSGSSNVVIYCYKDSYAHYFAEENLIDYLLLDPIAPTEPVTEAPTEEPTISPTVEPTEPITPTQTPTEQPTEHSGYLLGDFNNNGIVNILDVTCIQRHLVGLKIPTTCIISQGDVDGSNSVTSIDATLMMRYFSHLSVDYPIGTWVDKNE